MTHEHLKILGQACAVGQLIYATMNVPCTVYDLISGQILTIPKDTLNISEYEQMAKLGGTGIDINSIHEQCKKQFAMDSLQTISLFYGTSSMIVSVGHNGKHIANLVVGPVLEKKPEEILLAHLNAIPHISSDEMSILHQAIISLHQQSVEPFEASLQIISALLAKNTLGSSHFDQSIGHVEDMDSSVKRSKYPIVVELAIQYIAENYTDNISLHDVARYVSVHSTYLSRLFRHHTGCSFREYVNRLRISRARQLLLDPEKSTAAISLEIGFSDQSYFCRIFKSIEGITPANYRKSNMQDCRVLAQRSS